jgi:hypothetical protein
MNVNGRVHFLLQIGFWSIEMMATQDQKKQEKRRTAKPIDCQTKVAIFYPYVYFYFQDLVVTEIKFKDSLV